MYHCKFINNLKSSNGLGVDISKDAISIATKNSIKHELANRIKFFNIVL